MSWRSRVRVEKLAAGSSRSEDDEIDEGATERRIGTTLLATMVVTGATPLDFPEPLRDGIGQTRQLWIVRGDAAHVDHSFRLLPLVRLVSPYGTPHSTGLRATSRDDGRRRRGRRRGFGRACGGASGAGGALGLR